MHALQIAHVAHCMCCTLHMLQIASVANCKCCKLQGLQIARVANGKSCKWQVLQMARLCFIFQDALKLLKISFFPLITICRSWLLYGSEVHICKKVSFFAGSFRFGVIFYWSFSVEGCLQILLVLIGSNAAKEKTNWTLWLLKILHNISLKWLKFLNNFHFNLSWTFIMK